MQPNNNNVTWDGFQARKPPAAALETQLAESIKRVRGEKAAPAAPAVRRPRKPGAGPEAPATLADVLKQAVALAIARQGRAPREVAVREETLLEVLTGAIRGRR